MPTHIIIDLETIGLSPGCEIRSIAAVAVRDGRLLESPFYLRTRSAPPYNGLSDPAAVKFWDSFPPTSIARRQIESPNYTRLPTALEYLAFWCSSLKTAYAGDFFYWSQGTDFDLAILSHAFQVCGISCPWAFWQQRDLRTAAWLLNITPPSRKGRPKHHALHDAIHEAKVLLLCMEKREAWANWGNPPPLPPNSLKV